jgi:hypothetical protein
VELALRLQGPFARADALIEACRDRFPVLEPEAVNAAEQAPVLGGRPSVRKKLSQKTPESDSESERERDPELDAGGNCLIWKSLAEVFTYQRNFSRSNNSISF